MQSSSWVLLLVCLSVCVLTFGFLSTSAFSRNHAGKRLEAPRDGYTQSVVSQKILELRARAEFEAAEGSKYCDHTTYLEGSWKANDGKNTTSQFGRGFYSTCPYIRDNMDCIFSKRATADLVTQSLMSSNYRWEPEKCTFPFSSPDSRFVEWFTDAFANEVVFYMGDSMTESVFSSLACLLYHPTDTSKFQVLDSRPGRPILKFAVPEHNLVVVLVPSKFLVRDKSEIPKNATTSRSKIATSIRIRSANTALREAIANIQPTIVVMSHGSWWRRNKIAAGAYGDIHISEAIEVATGSAINYILQSTNATVVLRALEWKHHTTPSVSNQTCRDFDRPLHAGEYQSTFADSFNWTDGQNRHILAGLKRIRHSWCGVGMSVPEFKDNECTAKGKHRVIVYDGNPLLADRVDAHPGRAFLPAHSMSDCSHYCLPGVPDIYNMHMYWSVQQLL